MKKKKLAYITDLTNKPDGGGSYAVNWNIQNQLRKHFDLYSPAPIRPSISEREKLWSRIQRYLLKKPSRFFYFSPSTLKKNAKNAAAIYEKQNAIDGVIFRSATRWCHCKPSTPYFIYLDVVFHTFFENTFKSENFIKSDLERIYHYEAEFLENASAVFFENRWGMEKAKKAYQLKRNHYYVCNRGGVIEPPAIDVWNNDKKILLSIAMNFKQKGGDITLNSFKELKKLYPHLRWHIIGGKPCDGWEFIDGITYEGFLDPTNPKDLIRFRKLLSNAFLFIHPTREDTSPLVLTEAAYFGCPSISVNKFAIPELVINNTTGILLNSPITPEDLTDTIQQLMENPKIYYEMRKNAFNFSRNNFSWNNIGNNMAEKIKAHLS